MVAPGSRKGTNKVAQAKKPPAPKKKATAPSGAIKAGPIPALTLPLQESQLVLNLFARTFADGPLANPSLQQNLQIIKGHLFNREYLAAFSPEKLPSYAVRWSPSRALLYRSVFETYAGPVFSADAIPDDADEEVKEEQESATKVVCIGGGAGGELVGAAACFAALAAGSKKKLHLTAVDIAEWGSVVDQFLGTVKTDKRYGSEGRFDADFVRADILEDGVAEQVVTSDTKLLTICFTTNELYTQSRAATTKLFLGLAEKMEAGALLLVVESAGSWSTVKVGDKVFDMGMLLEHTLLGPKDGADPAWEMVKKQDSRWFRLPEGLRYPLQLEDSRIMVRVFQRT